VINKTVFEKVILGAKGILVGAMGCEIGNVMILLFI
jgi:hypothetical protein